MMPPVDRNPVWRRFHHTARSQQDEGALQPARTGKAAVSQQAMEAEVNADGAEDVDAESSDKNAGPAEEPGNGRQ